MWPKIGKMVIWILKGESRLLSHTAGLTKHPTYYCKGYTYTISKVYTGCMQLVFRTTLGENTVRVAMVGSDYILPNTK